MKNTELSPILFPVELKQIFFNHNEIPIPNYNAVVGLIDGEQKVFSVVTNSYKLITNQDAVVIGETLLKKVFHNTNLTEFKIFNVRYPTTKSFCHIDFIHKNYTFNIDDTEVFLPIIRITNSYNRTKALSFSIGFSRKLCKNGIIIDEETIQFKFHHTSTKLNQISILGFNKIETLKKLEKNFIVYVGVIKKFPIEKKFILPIVAKALRKSFYQNSNQNSDRVYKNFMKFQETIHTLTEKYVYDFGETGYTVFNVLTDYVSNSNGDGIRNIQINSLQKKAGKWLKTFSEEIQSSNFNIEEFLGDYLEYNNG